MSSHFGDHHVHCSVTVSGAGPTKCGGLGGIIYHKQEFCLWLLKLCYLLMAQLGLKSDK